MIRFPRAFTTTPFPLWRKGLGPISLLFTTALAACATAAPAPIIKYVDVKVPVNRSCIPADFPKAPTYPATQDAIKAAIEPGDLIVLLAKDREERIKRSDQTEPLVENCR